MAVQTGKSYELLTQQVFQERFANAIPVPVVRHNVRLQGIRALHQIDVYCEFELGGITYRTVVQCKDWSYPVEQEHLFAFKTILDDLPGQPRGVFVARSGIQRGARRFAEAEGIVLCELPPYIATPVTASKANEPSRCSRFHASTRST
ncbi:MAG: restriction endonuclease [Myxococcota bacterium]|nr:restriction endonuclease [Myxococcota bacterium]